MDNETGKELYVYLDRKDCENLNYEQIRTQLIQKAITKNVTVSIVITLDTQTYI